MKPKKNNEENPEDIYGEYENIKDTQIDKKKPNKKE